MKKQRREKSDRYRSIGQKQMTVLIVSVLLSILLFSGYFFFSVRQNSVQEYVQRSENAVDVSVHNIDYYIENCISSARSIYVDNDIVSLLSQNSRGPLTTGQMEQIYSYLQTVYYSTSGSEQIFLASLRLSQSFLYIAKYLQSSATELSLSIEELPSFSSWRSLYVQPTHTMSSYGHVTRFDAPVREAPDELVFTLWFPVYNLPQGDEVIALVAIDFPIAFLNQNCQLVYEDDEQMYIADMGGMILAASDETAIFRNLAEICADGARLQEQAASYYIADGQLVLQRQMESKYLNWKIVKTVPLEKIYRTNLIQTFVLITVFLCGLGVVVAINASQVLHYTKPLRRITDYMQTIVRNKKWKDVSPLSSYVEYRGNDELGLLVTTFESMLSTIQYYIIQQYELELAYIRSTLKMLQAQINPHFIYNTLQCFATSALKKQDLEQYHLISSFGQMLHYAMVLEPVIVPLQAELDYVERYLALQQMRFKHEADISFSILPGTDICAIPRMTLQPLVENSILHGNILQVPGSILHIETQQIGNMLHVSVVDNGKAVSSQLAQQMHERVVCLRQTFLDHTAHANSQPAFVPLQDIFSRDAGGRASIGMENVLLRLLLNFGKDCEVSIFANDLGGTTVVLQLPYRSLG